MSFPPPDASPFVNLKLPERSAATLPHRVGSYGDELRLSGQQSYRNAGRQAHYDRQGNTCLEEIRKTVIAGRIDQRVGLIADRRRKNGGRSEHHGNNQWPGINAQNTPQQKKTEQHNHKET